MNLLEAINDQRLFGPFFKDRENWTAWLAFIAALFAHSLNEVGLAIYRECTGRVDAPKDPFREAWLIIGRRGGKSKILATIAAFLAAFIDYSPYLAPGERGTILIIAADRKQARVILRYLKAMFTETPMLARMVARETEESIDLNNGVTIEVATASFRSVRGYTIIAALCDEIAFWRSEESANPDREVLDAIRPGMATIPTAMLLCASSSYARRGALYEAWQRHYGKNDSNVLVWQAPTLRMNPTLPQAIIDDAYERDPSAAAAEWGAEFRSDLEDFLTREAVMACVETGVLERPPLRRNRYVAFVDPSGGVSDSMTLAVAHKEGDTVILDAVRERKPPFSPEAVVEEFCDMLKTYRCTKVFGDRYGGEWCREPFRRHGINYEIADRSKSGFFLDLLPLLNSQAVDLLDHDRLVVQLVQLERRVTRGGRDTIDHRPGGHDDIANAMAGAVVTAAKANVFRIASRAPVLESASNYRPHERSYR